MPIFLPLDAVFNAFADDLRVKIVSDQSDGRFFMKKALFFYALYNIRYCYSRIISNMFIFFSDDSIMPVLDGRAFTSLRMNSAGYTAQSECSEDAYQK